MDLSDIELFVFGFEFDLFNGVFSILLEPWQNHTVAAILIGFGVKQDIKNFFLEVGQNFSGSNQF